MATTKTKYRRTRKNVQVAQKGLKDRIAAAEQKLSASNGEKHSYNIGDTVRVHVKIKEGDKERIQAYEGVVIAKGNHGGGRSFVVRKMSHGVGVERIFQERSPKVAKLEVVSTGKVRRAKLYFLRELQGKAAKLEKDKEAKSETETAKK